MITPTDVHSIQRTFQIIQAEFRKIGIQLKQKALDSSAAFDAITAPNGKYTDFDLSMWDWVGAGRPRLHALGRHVRAVRRLVGQRLLRQEVRRDVLASSS